MNKLKLCNVHKLAFANEGEGREPILAGLRPGHPGRRHGRA